jgi:hypothetical protein
MASLQARSFRKPRFKFLFLSKTSSSIIFYILIIRGKATHPSQSDSSLPKGFIHAVRHSSIPKGFIRGKATHPSQSDTSLPKAFIPAVRHSSVAKPLIRRKATQLSTNIPTDVPRSFSEIGRRGQGRVAPSLGVNGEHDLPGQAVLLGGADDVGGGV